jgi:hypothetical protein
MEKLKNLLQYIFGIALLIFAIPMFFEGGKGIIGSLIMLTGALICIPPTRKQIETKFNFSFNRTSKYVIIILSWFSIGIFAKTKRPTENEMNLKSTIQNVQSPKVENKEVEKQVEDKVNLNTSKDISYDTTTRKFDINGNETSNKTVVSKPNLEKEKKIEPYSNSYASTTPATTTTTTYKRKKKKSTGYGNSYTSGRSGYTRGPRGGCYYINENGKKVYVDHSYCN